MSIDLSQFIPTFLEESAEGLELMESSLLNLDGSDAETINAIFRAAHSIKGGAGTFGFMGVSEFTHVVETLLDQVRDGKREITDPLVNLLLESVDCIRLLLDAANNGVDCDSPQVEAVHNQLKAILSGESVVGEQTTQKALHEAPAEKDNHLSSEAEQPEGWQISFVPHADMLQTGNDPLLMFQALQELGRLEVKAVLDDIPELSEFHSESCYLSWSLRLHSACSREEVLEVFEWVEDECELSVEPFSTAEPLSTDDNASEESHSDAEAAPCIAASAEHDDVQVAQQSEQVEEPKAPETVPSASTTSSVASAPAARKPAADAGSIRVGIDKVDALINRVGELVITQSMLGQVGIELSEIEHASVERLHSGLNQLERNTRDLQEEVMRIRMLPISFVFNRFPRMVHDVGGKLGKKIELKLQGEQTELDKTVMEKIGDPLVHLVRNSLDHGLEMPEERIAAGKSDTGTVKLNAFHQGGYIVIEISDDGRGLNTEKILSKAIEKGLVPREHSLSEQEINELIFMPGFSTADAVSDLSGRGVGMDVVRRNIESLGGHVSVRSEPGFGSTFSVSLPLTLAILDGQLVQISDQTYIIPLVSIIESLQISSGSLNAIAGRKSLYHFREEYIPLIHLRSLFSLPGKSSPMDNSLLVVVESGGNKVGLVVDDLLSQQQVVIKSLESNYRRVEGISGATILGDGNVALILDVAGLLKMGVEDEVRRAVVRKNEQAQQKLKLQEEVA